MTEYLQTNTKLKKSQCCTQYSRLEDYAFIKSLTKSLSILTHCLLYSQLVTAELCTSNHTVS